MKVAKSKTRKPGKTPEHSERSQIIEELKYREQRYRSIAESTPDAMVTIDADGNIVLWNRAAEKIFGYTAEEILSKPLTRIMPKRFREAHKNSLNRVASGGKPRIIGKSVELIGLRKDKSEFPLELSMAKWKTGEGAFFTAFIRDISERKRAEEALQQSEENLRNAQILGLIGSWEFDVESQKITWAENTYRLYERDPALGTPTAEEEAAYYSQEQVVKLREYARRAIEEGKDFKYDLEADLPSGRHVFYSATMKPIKDTHGRVVKLFGTVQDITERKLAEVALRERWKELTCLYGVGLELQKDLPVDDLCRLVIEHLVAAMQFPDITAAVIELDSRQFTSEKYTDRLSHSLQAEIRVGGDVCGHLWVYYTEQRPFIVPYEQNLVTGIAQTLGLWLERKLAEEVLRQSQERYQNLVENINDVIFEVDTEGNITYISPAIERIGKYKADELIGQNFSRFVHPDDMPGLISSFLHVLAGILKPFEFRVLDKDGSIRYARTNSRQRMQHGQVIGITGVLSDITEQRKMMANLTVTDRLAALGSMAGGFAHELNNPLTGVIGYAQLLLDRKDLSEDVRRDLTGIYEEAQRASEVIKNFMVFALKRPLQMQLSDINSFIKDVLKLRQYEQKSTNIKVKTNFDPELPLVMVGPVRMHQVFLNIIINAEYFMFQAHKKGTLTITTEGKGDIIRASFADDGPGIPLENLEQMFNPFFTTKEVGQGIGLGLSICHSIVTEHGGNIYVESEPGKGATFIVELPVSKGKQVNKKDD